MTKYKCDNCGKKHDRIHIVMECSNCYIKGALKERKKERKRILKLIDEFEDRLHWIAEYPRNSTVKEIKEELKQKIQGEEETK